MSSHTTPEQEARETIDASLRAAGWAVQSLKEANLDASRGVAIRELHMKGASPTMSSTWTAGPWASSRPSPRAPP